MMRISWLLAGVVAAIVFAIAALAADVQYSTSTSTTSPTVTFGPRTGQRTVVGLFTSCDKSLGCVKFYGRPSTAAKFAPSTSPDAAATNVVFANPSTLISNGDTVVYCHANGRLQVLAVTSETTNGAGFSSALTYAGATGDYLYEVQQQGQIVVADNGANVGTNQLYEATGNIFVTPADSPLYVTLDSLTNTALQVVSE